MMHKLRKTLSVLLVVGLIAGAFAGCSPETPSDTSSGDPSSVSGSSGGEDDAQGGSEATRTLNIRAVIDPIYGPTFQDEPINDSTLNDLIQQKIIEHTGGVDVQVEWIVPSSDQVRDNYLNMLISANDVPEVLAMNDLPASKDSLGIIDSTGIVRELSQELIETNMPAYTARIADYGGDLASILADNQFEGKNLYLPSGFHPNIFPELVDDNLVVDGIYYGFYFRDDILTQIFPDARTEAELKELLLEQGDLSIEDVTGDIPIRSMEDLYEYLKQVKDLNLKVGESQVIPANIFSSSEMADSALWSLATATGYAWQAPLFINNDIEKSEFPYACTGFEEYCRWLNTFYNEGLIDPEIFVMKDDQQSSKAVNGEYAVVNSRLTSINEVRATGAERGYGYRFVPAFYPLDFSMINNSMVFVTQTARGPVFTTTIQDEDVEAVMKWVDFYMSEEYDEIKSWGSPDWYEGEGADRTYKEEYKDVENWVLYGESGEKDGTYYHMPVSEALGPNANTKSDPVLKPAQLSFFGSWIATYPDGPYYVLEKDPSKLSSTDVGIYSENVVNRDAMQNITRYRQEGWSTTAIYTEKWQAFENQFWSDPTWIPSIATAITAAPGEFDAKWGEYEAMLDAAGRREAEADAAALLKDMIENHSTPVQ